MGKPKRPTSAKKPKPFDPDAEYPPFDKNATENIGGKSLPLIASLLDTTYLHRVPDKLVNLSTLSPYDHHIREAIVHNIALQLLETLRPGWPLRIMVWLVMPDQMLQTRTERQLTEKYLADSLLTSPERKAALFRVISEYPPDRIALMSKDAQNTVFNVLQQMTSAPQSNE